jgi:uncharacterized protein (DUF1330 family)
MDERFARRVAELLEGVEEDRPLAMINLLRYREQADYGPEAKVEPCSGREAYRRYAAESIRFIEEVGGEVLWRGSGKAVLVGPPGERWDTAILVRYPSKAAFLAMVSKPEYQAIAFHRSAALEDSRLIATTMA